MSTETGTGDVEPRTAAGRDLVTFWLSGRTHPPSTLRLRDFTDRIFAIEEESRRLALAEVEEKVLEMTEWSNETWDEDELGGVQHRDVTTVERAAVLHAIEESRR